MGFYSKESVVVASCIEKLSLVVGYDLSLT